MIDRGKRSVLGIGISTVDYEGAVHRIIKAAQNRQAFGVSALAVHGVMTGVLDPAHKYRLNKLEMVTPDGQPVRWALKILHGESLPDRVYGPNLTLLTCEQAAAKGLPVYLYGSKPEVLDALKLQLVMRFPDLVIAGAEPSKFRKLTAQEADETNRRIEASGARIVLVGLGCPRQETFAYEHREALRMPVLAVGAAFDFHAGLLKQAPKWMQDRGLEWLFRMTMEPKRLWRRYLFLNPYYLFLIACQKVGLLQQKLAEQSMPKENERFG